MNIKNYGETNFITGMRAFAALAVLFIHSGGGGLRDCGYFGNALVDLGKAGVYVFFVISGYSVAQSYVTSSSFVEYINKRFWRIAPLYYFSLALYAYFAWVDSYSILMHITFLSFLDYKIANNIIGVEWTLPIEFFWYFITPLIILYINGKRRAILSIPIAIIYLLLLRKVVAIIPMTFDDKWLALHWSPLPYFLSFVFGISAFRLKTLFRQKGWYGDFAVLLSIMIILIYLGIPSLYDKLSRKELILISLITYAIILFGSSRSVVCNYLFTNRLILFLGTISYSIYLNHYAILHIVGKALGYLDVKLLNSGLFKLFAATVVTIIVSTVTYYLIEKPAMKFGKKLYLKCSKINSKSALKPNLQYNVSN